MINAFQGENRWLSNFYPAVVQMDDGGKHVYDFPTVEHAYQAAKFEPKFWPYFLHGSAGNAKLQGRRTDWERKVLWNNPRVKLGVMYALLQQKFDHPHLAERLRATGDAELVEGNHWGDVFWGVCRGVGENHLGKLLMRVRTELRT